MFTFFKRLTKRCPQKYNIADYKKKKTGITNKLDFENTHY